MKKQIISVVGMLSLLVAIAVSSYANLLGTVNCKIPFGFNVGKNTLPAGTYSMGRINSNGELIVIRNLATHQSIVTFSQNTQDNSRAQQGQVTFHRYGNTYFLAKVTDGLSGATELPMTNAEREAAKEQGRYLANHNVQPEIIVIAAQ